MQKLSHYTTTVTSGVSQKLRRKRGGSNEGFQFGFIKDETENTNTRWLIQGVLHEAAVPWTSEGVHVYPLTAHYVQHQSS